MEPERSVGWRAHMKRPVVIVAVVLVVVTAGVLWTQRGGGVAESFDHGWEDCTAPQVAEVPSLGALRSEPADRPLRVDEVADVDAGTGMAEAADGSLLVTTKPGLLVRLEGTSVHEVADFSDRVSGGVEQGLLDIALDARRGLAYLTMTVEDDDLVLVAMDLDGDGIPIPGSDRVIMEIEQPHEWHNGGSMDLGADGLLWIGLGDGGSIADPFRNGQDPATPLASILRIEPTADGYLIPVDNPFADGGGDPRVVAYGFRNPWSIDIDPATGLVWIADVGQYCMEELNVVDPDHLGGNHGWSRLEGTRRFLGDLPAEHVLPVFEYHHDDGGCAITGGGIYRGEAIPWLVGSYVYADYCRGALTAATMDGTVATGTVRLGPRFNLLGAIETDAAGELYLLTMEQGIWRVVP